MDLVDLSDHFTYRSRRSSFSKCRTQYRQIRSENVEEYDGNEDVQWRQ